MGNIHITIKLFAMLREGRFDAKTGEFSAGTTVCEIIQQLGIPEKEVTLIFINGRHGQPNTQLMDGDTVALFPPVGGG
jgi:molybdopterin converting factor small subunit